MTAPWPSGVARRVLPEAGSSNDIARAMVAGTPGDAWVLVLDQTGGRGRRGRPWMAGEGQFTASYLTRPAVPLAELALMSFAASLALADAIDAATGQQSAALKWPNDVLLRGRKISGILLETVMESAPPALITGIGVNLARTPDPKSLSTPATAPISLAEITGTALSPEAFLDRLAPRMMHWQNIWQTQGFGPIREAWLSRATGLGQPIEVRLETRSLHGRFDGVDESGALLLSTPDGVHSIAAGDVHLPPAQDAKDTPHASCH